MRVAEMRSRPAFWSWKALFAEATSRPSTSADMVATRPIPTFTASFDSSLKCGVGSLRRRRMPSSAPPNTQANTTNPTIQSSTTDLHDAPLQGQHSEGRRSLTMSCASAVEAPDALRLGIAAHGNSAQRRAAGGAAQRVHHGLGYDQARTMLLGELLEARGEIDRVADGGEFLASRRAHIAGDRRAHMQTDTHLQRERAVGEAAPVDLRQHLAGGGHCMTRGAGILQRRAEDGHEAVAEKLVDEAAMAIHRLDHEGECVVEKRHHVLRRPAAGVGGEVADVEEHDADLAPLARQL